MLGTFDEVCMRDECLTLRATSVGCLSCKAMACTFHSTLMLGGRSRRQTRIHSRIQVQPTLPSPLCHLFRSFLPDTREREVCCAPNGLELVASPRCPRSSALPTLLSSARLFPRPSIRMVGFVASFPSASSPSTTLHVFGCVPWVHGQLGIVSCHDHVGGIHGGVGSRGTWSVVRG